MISNLQINPNAIDAHPISTAMANIEGLFQRYFKREEMEQGFPILPPVESEREIPLDPEPLIPRTHPDFLYYCSVVRQWAKRRHLPFAEGCRKYRVDYTHFRANQKRYLEAAKANNRKPITGRRGRARPHTPTPARHD